VVNLNVNINSDYAQILSLAATNTKLVDNNNSIQLNGSSDFQQLITELLNKNFSEEKIKIIENILNNEKLYNSLNQAVAFFVITGEIKNIPFISDIELENNNVINEISFSSNLNPQEKDLLIKALKISAIEISTASNDIEDSIPSLQDIQQLNIEKSNPQLKTNNFTVQNNYSINKDEINILNKISSSTPFTINTNLVETGKENAVIKNTVLQNIPVITKSQTIDNGNIGIREINQNNSIAVLDTKDSVINSQKIVLNQSLLDNNIPNNSQLDNVKINISKEINADNINLKSTQNMTVITDAARKILDNIKNTISDIKIFIDTIKNGKNITYKNNLDVVIDNLNIKIDNIINLINKIRLGLADDININQNIKENAEIIIREIISILPAIQNIIYNYNNKESAQNNFVAIINNKIETESLPAVNTNLHQIINSGFENENNSRSYQSGTLFNELKNSVLKIFKLLKELNGEMQIYRKIEYVYQPNTTRTSTITPDGVLLINLSPIDKTDGKLQILQPIISTVNTSKISNNNEISKLTIVQTSVNNNNINQADLNNNKVEYNIIQQNLAAGFNKQINIKSELNNLSLKQDMIYKNKDEISFIMNNISDFIKNKNYIADKSDKINFFKDIIETGFKIKQDIVIRQIVEKIPENLSINKKIEIKIHLKPENLGPVLIKIENKGKEISANIQVLSNEVKDILKANIVELKNYLNNSGFDVKDFQILMMNQNIGNNLSDASKNIYKEWEGAAVINNNIQETVDSTDIYNESFSYLNYLA